MESPHDGELFDMRVVQTRWGYSLRYKKPSTTPGGSVVKSTKTAAALLAFICEGARICDYDELFRECDGQLEGLELLCPETQTDGDSAAAVVADAVAGIAQKRRAEEYADRELEKFRKLLAAKGCDLFSLQPAFMSAQVSIASYGRALDVIDAHPDTCDFQALEEAAHFLNDANGKLDIDGALVIRAFRASGTTITKYARALDYAKTARETTGSITKATELLESVKQLGEFIRAAKGK